MAHHHKHHPDRYEQDQIQNDEELAARLQEEENHRTTPSQPAHGYQPQRPSPGPQTAPQQAYQRLQQPGSYQQQSGGYQQPQQGYQQPGYQQPQQGYQHPGYQLAGYQQPGYQQ